MKPTCTRLFLGKITLILKKRLTPQKKFQKESEVQRDLTKEATTTYLGYKDRALILMITLNKKKKRNIHVYPHKIDVFPSFVLLNRHRKADFKAQYQF